ncbi:MAG: deoxyribodipyrimidine photo-lyase [Ignavibacteria bacterium]|jgi:deoxyribodipyrimidine photo-lyase
MNENRIHVLKSHPSKKGPVVYWMQRDQRVNDNWAFIHSQNLALNSDSNLIIVFCLVPNFLDATCRQYDFLLKGLQKVEQDLKKKNIPFVLLTGSPQDEIPSFIKKINAGILVTDFNPLRITKEWKDRVTEKIDIMFHEVDAHNIVPCRIASHRLEFAAYTIRSKINGLLPEYLDEFIPLTKFEKTGFTNHKNDWDDVYKKLKINFGVESVDWIKPGEDEAKKALQEFLENRFSSYSTERNDPNKKALSNLSPYLHFGQISAQRIALEVNKLNDNNESKKTFLEELIVRRELSDNFCFYNPNYDTFSCFPDWAKKTLNEHRKDEREYIYSKEKFEKALTHDKLWNAAQLEMVNTGKMHGYMRMYWAKKILEWTNSPEEALETGIHLNDKYELDGRDPNGYVGLAWSIGGVHDRAWTERPVFGKIRYMNYNGCKRKFDVASYISKHNH